MFSGKPHLYYVFIALLVLLTQVFMIFYILPKFRGIYMDSNVELSTITKLCFNRLFAWSLLIPTGLLILLKFTCFNGKFEKAYVWSMLCMVALTVFIIVCGMLLLVYSGINS